MHWKEKKKLQLLSQRLSGQTGCRQTSYSHQCLDRHNAQEELSGQTEFHALEFVWTDTVQNRCCLDRQNLHALEINCLDRHSAEQLLSGQTELQGVHILSDAVAEQSACSLCSIWQEKEPKGK